MQLSLYKAAQSLLKLEPAQTYIANWASPANHSANHLQYKLYNIYNW